MHFKLPIGSLLTAALGLAVMAPALVESPKPFENYVLPSWGDIVWLYGPGTDPAMDSPESLERMMKHWKARGFTGLTLRTDLVQLDSPELIRRNPRGKRDPKYDVIWNYIDEVSARFDVHEYGVKISQPLDFAFWAFHPHIYSDGAPGDVGSPGPGRIWPWPYCTTYVFNHPEVVTIDRKGNKYWMVREYAYRGARDTKVAEFVYMAKKYHLKGFISCMRSESSQLQPAPDKADRYGFNEPVVEDMKRLYGVDIMTDPRFDVDAPDFNTLDPMVEKWHDLRGSYVTQLYRELRQALKAVDPTIQLAVTLSGDHAGPPLGNWRLDWRTWVDEGLVDQIISPVFFEASLDLECEKKGYLTDVRHNKGVVPLKVLREYINQSKHPEIKLISGGGHPNKFVSPPAGADGLRTSIWHDTYYLAWYQRWEQLKRDLKENGSIKFFEQSFDDFPLDNNGHSGGWGDGRYLKQLRACPGCWITLGDGSDAKPVAQEKIRHGHTGRAMKLTRAADQRGQLIGWHASSPDRANFTWCLDNSLTCGEARFEYWLYRASDESSLTAYLQDGARSYSEADYHGETDVGLQIAPQTGRLSYVNGSNWVPTAFVLSPGHWEKFTIALDLESQAYSAFAGEKMGVELCRSVPLLKAKRRFIEQPGVNIPLEVPSYRMFNQVLFVPEGKEGTLTYLDDVSVKWVPAMYYHEPGKTVYLAENFEACSPRQGIEDQASLRGGKWRVASGEPKSYFIENVNSFGEGINCLHAKGGAELTARCDPKLNLGGTGTLTVDLDVILCSDRGYPDMVPNPSANSKHQTTVSLKGTGQEPPALGVSAAEGFWQFWDGDRYVASKIHIAYDVWNHLQMSLDKSKGTYQVVVQPVGEMPIRVGTGHCGAGQQKDLCLALDPSNTPGHSSLYDNILITGD